MTSDAERLAEIDLWCLTLPVFRLVARLDRGESCAIDEVRVQASSRNLLGWLRSDGIIAGLSTDDRAYLNDYFDRLNNAVDSRRKFDVDRNGYAYTLALFIEAIQQRDSYFEPLGDAPNN